MITVVTYESEYLAGDTVRVATTFVDSMDCIVSALKENNLRLYCTSSLRSPFKVVNGAIVPPSTRSNHFVGHSIDHNLIDHLGKFYNSTLLKRSEYYPPINSFYARLAQEGIRWGGNFRERDVVHLDDGLNLKNPDLYSEYYYLLWGEHPPS